MNKHRNLFLETHPMYLRIAKRISKMGHKVKTCAPGKGASSLIKYFKLEPIFAMGWTPANNTPISSGSLPSWFECRVPL